jgi:sugar phosphate isomerase/epimerase
MTADIHDVLIPSILLAETHFALRGVKDVIADAVERVAAEGFYGSVEIAHLGDPAERRCIGNVVRQSGMRLTQWMSLLLNTEGLNLSSADETLRARTVDRLKEHVDYAAECGAATLGVLSGPDPGPSLRPQATEQLYVSLCQLAETLEQCGSMNLALEPLDRGAHKNGLLGPTAEVVGFMDRLRQEHPCVRVSWDTAHAALCGEDIVESLRQVSPYVLQVHLANAILDRTDPGFGDHHMPFGSKGFLDAPAIADLFIAAEEAGLFSPPRLTVAVEVRGSRGKDPWETERHGREVLIQAWELYRRKRTPS